MTIASQTSRISYTGDGSTTAFAVPFYFAANADLVVILQDTAGNQTTQVLGTNYSLTGATLSAGGTCTFIAAPTTGYLVTIYRDPAVTQATSYNNNDPFPAKSHELALDKLTTIAQRTRDLITRSIRQSEGEGTSLSMMLAPVATRKNKLFGFDTNGALIYPLGPTFVAGTAIGVVEIDSRATALVTTIPVSTNIIRTSGYTSPGDGGDAVYKRKASQPSHSGKFQSADGAWWEIVPTSGLLTVDSLGAVADPGDLSTDSRTAIQAAFDTATTLGVSVAFGAKAYVSTGSIVLVNASGKNFQGNVVGVNKDLTKITFTNNGNAADADSAMQHGFEVYPVTNSTGGDITGFRRGEISGIHFVGPSHGASIYMANSQQASVRRCFFSTNRYGIANECCIHSQIVDNTFADFKNAGVGLIMSGDTARVWYASGTPSSSFWNDSPRIAGNQFTSAVAGGLAHILDYGSQAECTRLIEGNLFFNNVGANAYGYLARLSQPTFISNWFEDVKYPVRMLNSNVGEGGAATTLIGVTAAEPGGTYTVGAFPDGFCFTGTFTGNFTSRATDSFDLTGIVGAACFIGQNFITQQLGTAIVNRSASNSLVVDSGNYVPSGTYKNITSPTHYTLIASNGSWTTYTPTIAAQTGTITSATASGRYGVNGATVSFTATVTTTTNGTGAGSFRVGLPFAAQGGAGLEYIIRGRNDTTGADLLAAISSGLTYATVLTTGQTYPNADATTITISGVYEKA